MQCNNYNNRTVSAARPTDKRSKSLKDPFSTLNADKKENLSFDQGDETLWIVEININKYGWSKAQQNLFL